MDLLNKVMRKTHPRAHGIEKSRSSAEAFPHPTENRGAYYLKERELHEILIE